ncbi:MAG TPA: hypothetical protein EYQ53_01815 [Candidatus Poseidoniales archaeon]|jgi:ERCC4-type nuclease|nr:MAG: hypothetical protein CXT69_06745 [Euryarchaeota archaeon]HIG03109.1 hypothetical protein [Candidatus Poseidoniales archaeon]HIK78481.1 hypothetical protein [Candidatus Poseidoniales archaeon]
MASSILANLRALKIDVDIETLAVGDIAIGDLIIIERKTSRDLIDSLLDKRIFRQARRLIACAPQALLIVEGADSMSRAVHSNAIAGLLAHLSADIGLTIIPTKNTQATARVVAMLAKKEKRRIDKLAKRLNSRLVNSEEERIERRPKSAWTKHHASGSLGVESNMTKGQSDTKAAKEKFARGVEVLQAFPSIGRVRARKLMLEFGSPAKVFSASEDRLARNGISPQRLAQMLEILG